MKRLLLALAGYAIYRWWNSPAQEADAPPAPRKRPPTRPRPANPV